MLEAGPGSPIRLASRTATGCDCRSVLEPTGPSLSDAPDRPARRQLQSCGASRSAVPARSTADISVAGLPAISIGYGVPGWAWSDVAEHFRAIETDLDFGGGAHGTRGQSRFAGHTK